MGGYDRTSFSFLAVGGCYQYDSGTLIGCLPANEIGIGYQQKFDTVYLGLAGKYFVNAFEFGAELKYGPWVDSNDIDQHYQRNLTFKEHGTDADFYSASITSAYNVNPATKLFIEAVYNHFTNTKADTEVTDNITGSTFYIPDAAGLNNKNYFLSLGVKYRPDFSDKS
jgi:outer membrane protease